MLLDGSAPIAYAHGCSESKLMWSPLLKLSMLVLVLGAVPSLGNAQQAPTGSHYGGRPSDTGYAASLVSAGGLISTSIPLDLPS